MVIGKVKEIYDEIRINGIVGTASIYYSELKYRILRLIPISKMHRILHECRTKFFEKKREIVRKLLSEKNKIKEKIHEHNSESENYNESDESINVYNKGGV